MEFFSGEFENRIDKNGRVSIPSDFRRILEKGDPERGSRGSVQAMILYGWKDLRGLEVYTVNDHNEMLKKIDRYPARSSKAMVLKTMVAQKSHALNIDESGRVFLPKKLMEAGQLEYDCQLTFAGLHKHFEIRMPQTSELFDQKILEDYEKYIDPEDPFGDLEEL